MITVHALSQKLCVILRCGKSCPEYVTPSIRSTVRGDTAKVTHIHLAIGRDERWGSVRTSALMFSEPIRTAKYANPQSRELGGHWAENPLLGL